MRGNTSTDDVVDYDIVARTNGRVPAAAAAATVPGGSRPGFSPKTYMAYAVVSLLGAWPLALVAIVSATSVSSKWAAGDREGAQRASQRARQWATASWIVGVMLLVITLTAG